MACKRVRVRGKGTRCRCSGKRGFAKSARCGLKKKTVRRRRRSR